VIRVVLKRLFGLREGEIKIALLMQGYIFFIIATLLIIKPIVNSLFISKVGVENLPYGYLLVALAAVITSHFYSKATEHYSLLNIIRIILSVSFLSLLVLGLLLHLNLM
jgi:AAA family ATP:ADP antiporter